MPNPFDMPLDEEVVPDEERQLPLPGTLPEVSEEVSTETPEEIPESETPDHESEPGQPRDVAAEPLSIDDLLAEDTTYEPELPAAPEKTARPASPEPPLSRSEANKKLQKKFMELVSSENPADAFILAAEVGAQAAEERMLARLGPLQTSLLQTEVDRFKRDHESTDPNLFKAAQKDFDAFVALAEKNLKENPQLAANVNSGQVREYLESSYERATGRVFSRVRKKAKPTSVREETKPEPPQYGSRSAPGKPSKSVRPKTKQEQELRDMARLAGLNDADIASLF